MRMFVWVRSVYRSLARRAITGKADQPLLLDLKDGPVPVDVDLRWASPLFERRPEEGEFQLPYLVTDPRTIGTDLVSENALKRHVLWCDTLAAHFPERGAANDACESTGSSWTEGGPRP